MRTKMLGLILLLLTAAPLTTAQSVEDDSLTDAIGRGVIREAFVYNDADFKLNPLACDNLACERAREWLFPSLMAIDPETGLLAAGDDANGAIVREWAYDGDSVTITLRDDMRWSDGTPITATDVYFTLQALINPPFWDSQFFIVSDVESVEVVGENQIRITFADDTCDAYADMRDTPILPAHAFDPEFSTDTDMEEFSFFSIFASENHPFFESPSVTGGRFLLDEVLFTEHLRMTAGDLTYELVRVDNERDIVQGLLDGELTVWDDAPSDLWRDLSGREDLQTFTVTGTFWDMLFFNFGNPNRPQSYRDEDGEIRTDLQDHPLLTDPAIREAIYYGIDKQAIIDVALAGYGTMLTGDQSATSWAVYNGDEPVNPYDRDRAERILEDAGWRQINGRGTRICVACDNPDHANRRLDLDISYSSLLYRDAAVAEMARQLEQIGINITPRATDGYGELFDQRFDIYLVSWNERYPVGQIADLLYDIEEDIVGEGLNFGSYNSEAMINLLAEDTTCDIADRAALYRAMQDVLFAELPIIGLYTRDDVLVVRDSVRGVAPTPYAPLWNLQQWVIWD